jgi:hypothetical protein
MRHYELGGEQQMKFEDDAEEEATGPQPPKEVVEIPEDIKKYLDSYRFAMLVTDTEGSDLVISDPARIITDMVSWCLAPGATALKSRVFGVVGSFFRALLRPITALPGAPHLQHMRVLPYTMTSLRASSVPRPCSSAHRIAKNLKCQCVPGQKSWSACCLNTTTGRGCLSDPPWTREWAASRSSE